MVGAQELTANIIYLMGGSFIVGSLFTILMLLILDIIRRQPEAPSAEEAPEDTTLDS